MRQNKMRILIAAVFFFGGELVMVLAASWLSVFVIGTSFFSAFLFWTQVVAAINLGLFGLAFCIGSIRALGEWYGKKAT